MSKLASYEWWTRALAGEKIGGPTLPVHENHPQAGFYRRQFRDRRAMGEGVAPKGTFVPVAIFEHDGRMVALIKGIPEEADKHWTYCCRHPVTEEAYRHAVETGEWLDVPPGSAPPTPLGHNAPADELESLKDQIASAADGVSAFAKIEDDAAAERAQSLRSRLLELSREADKKREALKKPHLEAGKEIDATYQPLVKSAKAGADEIARAIGAYETAKARAAEEARRKAEEAAKEGKPAPEAPPPPLPTQIKGAYGRAAAVKVVKVVTRVTDWDALWNFMRDRVEVQDVLAQLAQRAVTKGHTVPGVEVEEQRKVA